MTQSKTAAKFLTVLGMAITALVLLVPTASAAKPAAGYTQFAGCPSPEEKPTIEGCILTVINSGHFQMGSKDVPIENPLTLIGGVEGGLKGFSYNSEGGLLPAKQKVPGGLIGLTGLTSLLESLGAETLTLYAITELAGTPILHPDLSASLPIKVHLVNPLLNNSCYIGSNSEPIMLNLITGTTKPPPPNSPISGTPAKFSIDPEFNILHFKEGTYVDNSFAAPGANGCKLFLGLIPLSIDSIVNQQSGLPSPAGTNETVQNFDVEIAPSESVYP